MHSSGSIRDQKNRQPTKSCFLSCQPSPKNKLLQKARQMQDKNKRAQQRYAPFLSSLLLLLPLLKVTRCQSFYMLLKNASSLRPLLAILRYRVRQKVRHYAPYTVNPVE